MALTASVIQGVNIGGSSFSTKVEKSAEHRQSISQPFAADADGIELGFTLDVSQAKMIYIESTQDLQFDTNADGGAGGNQILLLAGVPYIWHNTGYLVNLLDTDITALFITQTGATAGVLTVEVLVDPTV